MRESILRVEFNMAEGYIMYIG